jgi:hypothetical protein
MGPALNITASTEQQQRREPQQPGQGDKFN